MTESGRLSNSTSAMAGFDDRLAFEKRINLSSTDQYRPSSNLDRFHGELWAGLQLNNLEMLSFESTICPPGHAR